MSDLSGSYEMQQVGGDHPVGSPDELRQEGIDPQKVASCAPRSPGVRGCNHWDDCPFANPRLGGFKTHGPKHVGYYIKTHEGDHKEDFCSCYIFTKTMLARMRAGIAFRDRGKPHEVIRIIAQEGEKILKRFDEALDKNNNKSGDLRRKIWETMVEVPKFARPGDSPELRHSGLLSARERARELADQDQGVYVREAPSEVRIEAVPDIPEAKPADG